jgi:hypothetical protein
MPLVVKGSSQFIAGPPGPLFTIAGLSPQGARKRKSPNGGEQWVLVYESAASNDPSLPSPAEVAYNLCPSAYTAEIDATGPTHKLYVTTPENPTDGTGGIIAVQYELLGNNQQFDLRLHPKAIALGTPTIKKINNVLNNAKDDNGRAINTEAEITTIGGDALQLYNLLLQENGNRAFQKSQYVFRVTQIASNRATINVAYSDVEKIYTTAQMLAETGPPSGILTAIADAVTGSNPGAHAGYQYGWLKQTPTVTTAANNKIQISVEFWLELWSTWIYDSA